MMSNDDIPYAVSEAILAHENAIWDHAIEAHHGTARELDFRAARYESRKALRAAISEAIEDAVAKEVVV